MTQTSNGHQPTADLPATDVIDLDHDEPEASAETQVLVDDPSIPDPRPARADTQRRPILPAWLRSRAEFADTARWAIGNNLHRTIYHALRIPLYAARLLAHAPRGANRVLTGTAFWARDAEGLPVRLATVRREDAEAYLKLSRQRDAHVRLRTTLLTIATAGLVAGAVALLAAPAWAQALTVAAVVALLGALGAPADRPVLQAAVVKPQVARLTSAVVIRALSVLGLAGITQALAKDPKAIGFAAPITRDGPGWRADINLPPGVTAAEVIDRRDKLASGLGRPLGCVWPEGRHEVSPGRLILWVGDQDVASGRPPTWPLRTSGSTDLFKPFPFGTDPRGRPVMMDLAYTNLLIGSIPGAGKTFSLRVPLLAAALDPRAELWVFELKGSGDLDMLGRVAARYASGQDDPDVYEALLALRDLRQECSRRAKTIKGLPKSICPENKVTPQLASRRSLGLHPLVVGIDECQELFAHPDYGDEAGMLAEKVIKLGRALGITLLLATQRPDAKSLPTGVSANVGTRFCLRVMGQVENDMILGTSAYKNGVRATMFTKRDKGVGYLVGGDDPQITRTYLVDGPAAEQVIARARAEREAAGTLTGYAAGEAPQQHTERADTLLEDLLGVVPATEAKVWTETALARLADAHPGRYGAWTRDQLTAALKPYGITTVQVWGTTTDGQPANRRGIERQAITDALADRNDHRRPA